MPAFAERAEEHIRSWLTQFVVGLNLCPFARPLLDSDALRIAICRQHSVAQLQRAFLVELDLLQGSDETDIATTLLAFPSALADFDDYLDFLELSRELLGEAGLEGVIQLASFHPHYRFAGEPATAASHYSNRSPYPIIHLLREDMLSRVLDGYTDPAAIPRRNIATLEAIGRDELARRWRALLDQTVIAEPVRTGG